MYCEVFKWKEGQKWARIHLKAKTTWKRRAIMHKCIILTRTLNVTPSLEMMLSACDHPRAGLLPNDFGSMPPSAPSILFAVSACGENNSNLSPKLNYLPENKFTVNEIACFQFAKKRQLHQLALQLITFWNISIEAWRFAMFEINAVHWFTVHWKPSPICVCVQLKLGHIYIHKFVAIILYEMQAEFWHSTSDTVCHACYNHFRSVQFTFQHIVCFIHFICRFGSMNFVYCIRNITQVLWIISNFLCMHSNLNMKTLGIWNGTKSNQTAMERKAKNAIIEMANSWAHNVCVCVCGV